MCGTGSGGRWPCPGPSSLPTPCTPLEKPSGDERQEPTSPTEAEARPPVCPEVLQLETMGAAAQAAQSPGPPLPQRHRVQGQSHPCGAGWRTEQGPRPSAGCLARVGSSVAEGGKRSSGKFILTGRGARGVSGDPFDRGRERAQGRVRGRGRRSHPLQGGREGAEGQCFPRPGSLLSFAPERLRQEPGGRGARSHPRAPSQTQDPAKAPREVRRHSGAGPLLIPKQRNPLCRLILCFHASWDRR